MGFKEKYADLVLLMLDYIDPTNLQMAILSLHKYGIVSVSMRDDLLYMVENKEELKDA